MFVFDARRMRILVTGATGMLGGAVVKTLSDRGFQLTCLTRHAETQDSRDAIRWRSCDLSEESQIEREIGSREFDAVVHCAAITNLSYCEAHPDESHRVHVQATETLASALPHARFLYISTDSVFDGRSGDYDECALPNPLNTYAATKLGGESAVQDHPNGLVIRTNMYDIRRHGGQSLAEWAYNSWTSGQALNGFTNVLFNPLHVSQLVDLILELLTVHPSVDGIIHLGCDTQLSKCEFLTRLSRALHFQRSVIHPVEFQDSQGSLARPLDTTLRITRAQAIFGEEKLSLETGLKALSCKVAGFGMRNAVL